MLGAVDVSVERARARTPKTEPVNRVGVRVRVSGAVGVMWCSWVRLASVRRGKGTHAGDGAGEQAAAGFVERHGGDLLLVAAEAEAHAARVHLPHAHVRLVVAAHHLPVRSVV